MQSHGWLERSFSWLVGSGPGAGMALLFVFSGVVMALIALACYFIPAIRNVEDLLKDQVQVPESEIVLAGENSPVTGAE
jgi:hypothetical protein